MTKIEELLKKLNSVKAQTTKNDTTKVDNESEEDESEELETVQAETKKLMTISEIIAKDKYNRVKITVTAEELTTLVDNDIIKANLGRNQIKILFVKLIKEKFNIDLTPIKVVTKKNDVSTIDTKKLQNALKLLKQLGIEL